MKILPNINFNWIMRLKAANREIAELKKQNELKDILIEKINAVLNVESEKLEKLVKRYESTDASKIIAQEAFKHGRAQGKLDFCKLILKIVKLNDEVTPLPNK